MAKARPVTGLDAAAALAENARAIIAVRVDEMFGFAHAIGDPAHDDDLHNMRIAAKRLRYTLEMFRAVLGDDGPALIDAVKEVQERIGTIHDADVLDEVARMHLAVVAQRQVTELSMVAGQPSPPAHADWSLGSAEPTAQPALPTAGEGSTDAVAAGKGSTDAATMGEGSEGDEERRVAAVRARLDAPADPRRGLAVLLARTRAGRARDTADLTSWWAKHGGEGLRRRLDEVVGRR